jgi:hypothetical protein
MENPSKLPRIKVIIQTEIKESGSFQPMINRLGISIRNEIKMPLKTEGNCKLEVAIIIADTTHKNHRNIPGGILLKRTRIT